MVTLPLYPGYKYAAYAAISRDEVILYLVILINNNSFILLQAGTVTFYNDRPVKLVYHICSFHILDMKVFRIYNGFLNN